MNHKSNFLEYIPPMGIYKTLYKFQDVFGTYMGEKIHIHGVRVSL